MKNKLIEIRSDVKTSQGLQICHTAKKGRVQKAEPFRAATKYGDDKKSESEDKKVKVEREK